ncbi:MAG: FAD-dependent oxidoreductase, partial [Mycolicibacterium frederiksbergense]|nr:FAD-dependent oxidoreductase [Mycolicibacterium frederiksbergense]
DPSMAKRVSDYFDNAGVTLRLACGVTSITCRSTAGHAVHTTLTDGTILASDHVVLALGAVPALDWLAGSGIPVGDGVLCNSHLQATESVFAVGDIANWKDCGTGLPTRVEHRTNAVEQAIVVAHNIACAPGDELSYEPMPYVWSDQLGHRIQIFGRPSSTDEVASADTDPAKPINIHSRNGRVVGVVGLDNAKEVRRFSQLIGRSDSQVTADVVSHQEVEAR